MIGFLEKFGKKIEPIADKLASNIILMSIRDGFVSIMALLLVGSFAIVLNNVILDWGETSLWYSLGIQINPDTAAYLATFKAIGSSVWQGTLAIMALLVSFTIAKSYAEHKKQDGTSAGILSLGTFFTLQAWEIGVLPPDAPEGTEAIIGWGINPANVGGTNIITAMLVAIIVSMIFCFFVKRNITIKMPEGVPPGVMKAFAALIPGTVIIFGAAILAFALKTGLDTEVSKLITDIIAKPIQEFGAKGPVIAYIYVGLSNLFWFFGIHGPNVLTFIDATVLTPAATANAAELLVGNSTNIFSKGMIDSFVMLGGSGTTLALIISIFIVGKRKSDRTLAQFALPSAIFNINEPLIFGLPIIMNPVLFIPFVLSGPILLTTGWLQIVFFNSIGLLPNMGAVLIPWVAPVGIGAFIGYQSFFAILIALIQLAIAIIIYLPFVFALNSQKDEYAE